ncbi:MAG: FGGY family carbohydrate kinase, partial [Eubacteriales bacterium]|nr:FGGY family carbohydrate kinase [Eubacteriales bacterium]
MKLAGLDIGTTACKMTIFTDRGEGIDSVSTRYPIVRTQSEHELDAAAVWQAVQSVIEKIASRHPD